MAPGKEAAMNRRMLKIWDGRVMVVLAVSLLLIFLAKPGSAQVVQIAVPMNGAQEVPPVATAGTGLGSITVNTISGAISGVVNFSGLTTPATAGHIHVGAAGVNGPVIVPLIGGLGVTAGAMTVPLGAVLLPAQITALRANGLYLNIHTTANLGGEIRGQIIFTNAVPVGSVDETALTQVVRGNFDLMRTGDEMAGLSPAGTIFVSMDMATWTEIPGDGFTKIFTGDFDGDGVDDLGGVSAADGSIHITTDFGLTWMTTPLPRQ